MDAATELKLRIEKMQYALRAARAYITASSTYREIGFVGDEKPVIEQINSALEN